MPKIESVHWISDKEIKPVDIYEIIAWTKENRRFLHINAASYGEEDGSTINWFSQEKLEKFRKLYETQAKPYEKSQNEQYQKDLSEMLKPMTRTKWTHSKIDYQHKWLCFKFDSPNDKEPPKGKDKFVCAVHVTFVSKD